MAKTLSLNEQVDIPMCFSCVCEMATDCMRHVVLGNDVVPAGYTNFILERLSQEEGCPKYISCKWLDSELFEYEPEVDYNEDDYVLVSEDTLMSLALTPMNQGEGVGGLYGAEECPYCGAYNDCMWDDMIHRDDCPVAEVEALDWDNSRCSKMYLPRTTAETVLRLSPTEPACEGSIIMGCECIHCREVGLDQWSIRHGYGCPIIELQEVLKTRQYSPPRKVVV